MLITLFSLSLSRDLSKNIKLVVCLFNIDKIDHYRRRLYYSYYYCHRGIIVIVIGIDCHGCLVVKEGASRVLSNGIQIENTIYYRHRYYHCHKIVRLLTGEFFSFFIKSMKHKSTT